MFQPLVFASENTHKTIASATKSESLNAQEMFLDVSPAIVGSVRQTAFQIEAAYRTRLAQLMAHQSGIADLTAILDAVIESDSREKVAGREPFNLTVIDSSSKQEGNERGIEILVAPLTKSEFYEAQYRDLRPVLFKGVAERFQDLMTWSDLNEILHTRNLRSPEMRLVHDENQIPDHLYMQQNLGLGARSSNSRHANFDESKLMGFLRTGATLIIDSIGSFHQPIADFLAEIETSLNSYVNANLYASWRSTRGFTTHWDDHDVFIVQVLGEKIWHLLGEARQSPTVYDVEPNEPKPKESLWEGKLRAGDVLYIPRGWWHYAHVDPKREAEGSLHLTVGPASFSGSALVGWLVGKVLSDPLFRASIPFHANETTLLAHLERIRASITHSLDDDSLRNFAKDLRSSWRETPKVNLNATIEPWRDTDWPNYQIKVNAPEFVQLDPRSSNNSFTLIANGVKLKLDSRCYALIEAVINDSEFMVHTLHRMLAPQFSAEFIDDMLRQLIRENVLSYCR